MPPLRKIPLEAPRIRVALALGFGLTLGLWLFAGYSLTLRMRGVQQLAEAANDRYARAQGILSSAQGQVLLASVYVRDLLLDPRPEPDRLYRRQLSQAYESLDDALARYEQLMETPMDRERLDRLRREVNTFRENIEDVINGSANLNVEEASEVLSGRVSPRREIVLRVAEEIRAQNLSAFVAEQAVIAGSYGDLRRSAIAQFGFALVASLGIALLATIYASRLENRLRAQRERDVQHTHELQRLSTKLITAQEEERRHIARELHDEVGQVLTAIKMELAIAQRKVEHMGAPAGLLEDARSITDGALSTVRDLSHLLHPALLDDLGLPDVLDWYVRGFSRRHGIRVDLHCDQMNERLVPEIEAAAYRIVQEALTNVARHADARDCRVSLRLQTGVLMLIVEDDGVGFDPAELGRRTTDRGLGLIGIRERVSELLGTLRIDSAPGRGTRVRVELPARLREPIEGAAEEEEVLNG